MAQPTVDQNFLDLNLEYVQKTSFALKRAVDENSIYKTAQAKAAKLRPELLKLGKELGCFPATQVKEAEAMLASHDTTLVLLKQAMEKVADLTAKNKTEVGDAADPHTIKAAGDSGHTGVPASGDYNSLTDPMVGNKSPRGKKASDVAFERIRDNPS